MCKSTTLKYKNAIKCTKEQKIFELQQEQTATLQKEIERAQKNALEVEARKQMELERQKLKNISVEKMALIAKFGYEEENDENEDSEDEGKTNSGSGEDSYKPLTNREYAAQVSLQNAQKLRSAHKQTKKEARTETAKAKADRDAKKEERRKRAVKGERRR